MALQHLLNQFHGAILDKNANAMAEHLRDNGRLSPERQMMIYIEGYRLRLAVALRGDYPELLALVGEDAFDALATVYIEAYAPVDASLDVYPFGFAAFAREKAGGFCGELAMLEGAIAKVFLLPDSDALRAEGFSAANPEDFAVMRMRLRSAAMLLALDFPVEDYFAARRDGRPASVPEAGLSPMMVVRHGNVVCRHVLHPVAFVLLSALNEGLPMGAALEQAAGADEEALEVLSAQLQHWFAHWAQHGFFQPVLE